jgi:hypothetical protein
LRLIHEIIQSKGARLGDKTIQEEAVVLLVDDGNTAMISHKVKRVGSELLVSNETLGRFSIVGKLEKMKHIGMLLLENSRPRVLGDLGELSTNGVVPHLPMSTRKNRVGRRDRTKLELRVGRERLRSQDLVRGILLLGIILPLDESSPALSLSGKELLTITDSLDGLLILGEFPKSLRIQGLGLGTRHVKDWEHSSRQSLLNLPLIRTI